MNLFFQKSKNMLSSIKIQSGNGKNLKLAPGQNFKKNSHQY